LLAGIYPKSKGMCYGSREGIHNEEARAGIFDSGADVRLW
jgi:hypothetical protein